ncbi:MAG: hypothetical protein M3Q30_01395 [Actinomycetota bacterium]|nr:hypothetical protein [Actinomycetota bacterium]
MWALGAIVRGRVCRALRFVVVVVVVLAAGVAVPLTSSASAQVPHAAVGPPFVIVPSPNPPGAVGGLSSVSCTSATNCFAVGGALIERWDGTSWAIVPSPNPTGATYSSLNGVSCTSSTNCFAVGWYYTSGSASHALVERWDGTSWTIIPSPNAIHGLNSVSCTSTTNCFAVAGGGLIERWNGTSWAIVPSPDPNPPGWGGSPLYSVSCTSTTSCFAVGSVGHEPGPWDTFVERWNGTTWAIVPSPNPNPADGAWNFALNSVSCTSTTSCVAVGNASSMFDNPTPNFGFVERWNGTSWTTVSSPNPTTGSVLDGVSCTSATNCFAIGYVVDLNSGQPTFTLVERWNGARWAIVRSANPTGATSSALYGVSCISTRSCFAVGSSSEGTLIERRK